MYTCCKDGLFRDFCRLPQTDRPRSRHPLQCARQYNNQMCHASHSSQRDPVTFAFAFAFAFASTIVYPLVLAAWVIFGARRAASAQAAA